ncbi:MAG: response regulator [Nitrospiraceae bacterium]|nr:response regulator [Nitrospiraceae bacterium]
MRVNDKKVLVVDDDSYVREFLKEFFDFYGYNADCACSGDEAIMLVKKKRYHIVITEYIIQGISSIELIERIKNLNSSLPVIAMSCLCPEGEFLKTGADFFINKPIKFSVLKDILDKVSST